jgi:hypothetical protein
MNRFLRFAVAAAVFSTSLSAHALRRIGTNPPGGDGDGGGVTQPSPAPPPQPIGPQPWFYSESKSGSIGGSFVGADYQAAIQLTTDATRTSLNARGYADAGFTLLGNHTTGAIINGNASATPTQFSTEVSAYVLTKQVLDYQDSFPTAVTKSFNANYKNNFWQWQDGWTVVGTGVTIQLALDGGLDIAGSASLSPLSLKGHFEPHVFVTAGGSLSATLFWISVGSLSGQINVADAKGIADGSIDATAIPSGGHPTWAVSGSLNGCTLGGTITGCVVGHCEDLASWSGFCTTFDLGSASGTI